MGEMTISAVTKNNKFINLTLERIEASLTFITITEAAKHERAIDFNWIPVKWRTEIFPEFMNPDGFIVAILITDTDNPHNIINAIYFTDHEVGRKLVIRDQNLIASLVNLYPLHCVRGDSHSLDSVLDYEDPVLVEMTMSSVMGEYEKHSDAILAHSQSMLPAPDAKFIIDDRPKCVIDLAPSNHKDADEFSFSISEDPIPKFWNVDEPAWRIYVDGIESHIRVSDLAFMRRIARIETYRKQFSPGEICKHDDPIFPLVERFLIKKDITIGADPINSENLAGHQVPQHLLKWGASGRIIYEVPKDNTDTFDFDDVNL